MRGAFLIGLALLLAAPAQAASRSRSDDIESSEPVIRSGGARGGSVLDGRTVGTGSDVFHLEAGWPGLTVSYLHGAADRFDLGLRLSLNYGYEGYPRLSGTPGVKLQAALRVGLFDAGKLGLALSFSPGILYYAFPGSTTVGFTMPLALGLNLAVSDALNLGAGLDVPLWITFGPLSSVTVPLLFGVGLEYFLDRNFALTFRMRVGPAINSLSRAELAFTSHVGIAVKL